MNLKAALQRHPEFAIHGLATLGVLGLFAANFSVCFPITSAEEIAVGREAAAVYGLATRRGTPDQTHENYAGAIRSQVDSVCSAKPMSDWTCYIKTEVLPVYQLGGPPVPAKGKKAMPMVQLAAKPAPEQVDLEWSFTAPGGPFDKKTMTLTLLRTLLKGPDGSPAVGAKEELLATNPSAGEHSYRDATVQPGCRYAYRVHIVEQGSEDKLRESASLPAEVAIVVPVRFTLSGVANGVAVIQVEKNFGGELGWRKDTFCVNPGERIGAAQTSMIPGTHGNLDFTTDFVLREIRTDEGARPARGASDVKLTATVAELVSKRYGALTLNLEK